jgi:Zn finger protein HypA/HybF involved in hydrogenase expression
MGCVSEKPYELEVRASENKVLDCQCHEEPWKYEPHLTTDCKDCHGEEVLPIHKPYAGEIEGMSQLNCSECHETSLLKTHLPKLSCETCHGDVYDIHKEFEEQFGISRGD